MVKITKHREEGGWRIRANGKDTGLYIEKGDAPRWGRSQEYDLVNTKDDHWLFTGRGVALVMDRVNEIYGEIADAVAAAE
jgi:hypothetical protein